LVGLSCKRREYNYPQRGITHLNQCRYLTVDYERSEFYLSQASFAQNASQHIITIPSINSTSSNETTSHRLPVGAIVGIAIGGVVVVVGLTICVLIFLKHTPCNKHEPEEAPPAYPPDPKVEFVFNGKPELDGGREVGSPAPVTIGTAVEYYPADKHASHEIAEGRMLPRPASTNIHEMSGDHPERHEMLGDTDQSRLRRLSTEPASPVSETSEQAGNMQELLGTRDYRVSK
jgi:hypothetical protein